MDPRASHALGSHTLASHALAAASNCLELSGLGSLSIDMAAFISISLSEFIKLDTTS